MKYKLQDIRKTDLTNKTILLRMDLDVPLVKEEVKGSDLKFKIGDGSRLIAGLSTINYLLSKKAKVIIIGHLGRPKGFDKNLSLKPVAEWFLKKFQFLNSNSQFKKIEAFDGWEISPNLFLLENLRFFEGEEKNNQEFSQKLAELANIYINDAFAVSHRDHASITGIARLLPSFAGIHLQEEVKTLSKILEDPKRPLIVIIGGVKIETKLPLVEKMHHFADYVLVGGKIAQETRTLLKVQHEKLIKRRSILLVAELNNEETDLTEKSRENFLQILSLARTVVWNGPLGKIEINKTQVVENERGTLEIAKGIIKGQSYNVVGGGDTIEFLKKVNLLNKFDFVSMGGGAMLSFLSGEKMPGLQVLNK